MQNRTIEFIKNIKLPESNVFWVIFMCGLLAACSTGSTSKDQKSAALTQMAKEFAGDYKLTDIKQQVDATFKAYSVNISELNYQRCADALIALRKASKNGVSEMDILIYVQALNARAYGVSFFKQLKAAARYLERKSPDLPS